MEKSKIQTLHPEEGKKGRNISFEIYEMCKAEILVLLQKSAPTFTEMSRLLTQKLKDKIEGNVGWYAMSVKLDLEARGIIERINNKPQTYRIKNSKSYDKNNPTN